MKTQKIKISELKPHPENPRAIRDERFKKLCESIQENPEYFDARPVIVSNRTGENIIVAGNQRYHAASFLKWKEVPGFIMSGLTEQKEREIMIRDNVSNGEWDYDLLANEWDGKELTEWGLDLPLDWSQMEDEEKPKKQKPVKMEIIFDNIIDLASCGTKIKEAVEALAPGATIKISGDIET